ncbi:hypothetical protein AA309_04285 [Microvirga vignae]|uniref:Uncharacterized protein n=1 Tax=Microvirga vignae TaxID=1225564 RepID=A0A0H1RG54_9HYPH|nr:hypothetical protein AA309_04285 [Microvirga vignae]
MRADNACHPCLELARTPCWCSKKVATFTIRINETIEVRRSSTGSSESVLAFKDQGRFKEDRSANPGLANIGWNPRARIDGRAGRMIVISDALSDPRVAHNVDVFVALQTIGNITVSLVKEGQLRASLCVIMSPNGIGARARSSCAGTWLNAHGQRLIGFDRMPASAC